MVTPRHEWPYTHHDLIKHYEAKYDENIAKGTFEPFVYPWTSLGALIIILYLLIPHQSRSWLRHARFLVFAILTGFSAYTIIFTRAKGMAAGLGTGLVCAWGVIYVAALMVSNDAQTDFQRIERTERAMGRNKTKSSQHNTSNADDTVTTGQDNVPTNGNIRNRHLSALQRQGEFAWQPYPLSPFIERLDWVLDVLCNFRGAGWSWRISAIPPPPKHIQEELQRNSTNPPCQSARTHPGQTHPGQTHVYPTRHELLIANTKALILGYLVLDALKTFMNHDPHFWGLVNHPPPSYFPSLITSSAVLTHMYRLTFAQLGVLWALKTIFTLSPLFFSGVLGPSLLGARGSESWMYPETWGSYTQVLDRGLAGWWSGWWHQTFRFAFEQPSRKIIEMLGMSSRSPLAKLVQLFVAFGLSGVLHACGSYTCNGETQPLRGPMRFFLLQPVALFVEAFLTQKLGAMGVQQHVPRWMMRACRFVYVHFWFYHTAHVLVDDFARCGVWLFEPVPVSLFRGLGLGVEGDGLWCLRYHTVGYHSKGWKSGLAL